MREDPTNAANATSATNATDVTTLSLEDLVIRATAGPVAQCVNEKEDAQAEAPTARSVRESEPGGTSLVLSSAGSEEKEMLRADDIGDFVEWGS